VGIKKGIKVEGDGRTREEGKTLPDGQRSSSTGHCGLNIWTSVDL